MIAGSSRVAAFEFFGITLFEDQNEVDAAALIADPQPYSATLATAATGELEARVRSASTLLANQDEPANGAAGLLAAARADYKRILGALYEAGYYGGVITIRVGGQEAATLPPDTRLPKPVAVEIGVEPGPLFRFGRIGISNRAPADVPADDAVEAPESVGFAAGEVAQSTLVLRAETLAIEAWRQLGYADAAVIEREVVADHATQLVDVSIVVEPGRRAVVGPVAVRGTDRMDPDFVAQQTGLVSGAEYDPDDIERAERRLARLDVFRAMRLQAAGEVGSDGVLPFDVIVEEQAGRRFGVGASYSNVDGLGLEAFHLWRNLFGRAERLRLDAKLAGINWPIDSAQFDYAFGATFTKPGFFNPDNDLVAAISAERTVLPAYIETSAVARVGLTQYLTDDVTLDGALYYERSLFDDDFGSRDFSIAGLTAGAVWDTRDDPRDATEGFYLAGTAEPFYETMRGYLAFRSTAEARGYWGLMDDRFVLAGRAKVGALVGPDLVDIPPDRLFFAGGGGSVRGYAYRGIGVDNPDGSVSGGRYLLEGSLEARFKATDDIGIVGFLDAGYVAADTFPGLDQLRLGLGAGLRYYTGLGPLARRRHPAQQAGTASRLCHLCRHRAVLLMRRVMALAICGVAAGLALPLVAQDMSEAEQRNWFVQFVEGQLSTPERQIRISNIEGALSSQASIRQVTISDAEGVWMRINNAAIDWDQGALFTGRLLVRELTADSIDYLRNPLPSSEVDLPAPEASTFEVPEFPVAIQLDRLAIPSVVFGEGVFGLGSEISLAGSLQLVDGSLDAALDIERLDGPGGRLDLDLGYANADQSVELALTLSEPPDGILANLLNIEGRPEIELGIAGSGPVDSLRTALTLDAGGVRALDGTATIAGADAGLVVEVDLGGPIGTLVAPAYRAFFGERTGLRATALVRSEGGLEISGLSLSGGQLALEGSLATASDGFLERLALNGIVADPDGSVVLLPVPGGATSIQRAELQVDFGGGDWRANLAAEGFSNDSLSAQTVTIAASGVAENLDNPAARRLTVNADGSFGGISSPDPDVVAALGDSLGFGFAGLWTAGGPIQIAELRLVGEALTAALAGTVNDWTFDGRIGVETSSLAPFSGLAGRSLSGGLSLAATGSVSPLGGGFDLALDGTAENLGLSDAMLDRVLAGRVALGGRVARTGEGITAESFRLGNDQVDIRADGSFATGAADFAFAASLADLALLSDAARGRLEIVGSARGQGTVALDLTGRVPEGRLAGKTLREALFGFSGQLAASGAITGELSGSASLDGAGVSLAGSLASDDTGRRLSGLRFTAGPTELTGEVTQNEAGLLTGDLQLRSPDISTAAALAAVRASGSAEAAITLGAVDARQSASVTGQIVDLVVEDTRIGSADIRATIADLFGSPAVEGSAEARNLVVGGFTVDELSAEARQSGGETRFTADAVLSSDPTLSNAGLTPLRASANGSLSGRTVTLERLVASGSGGLELTGSGVVPLDGGGLDIAVDGTAPLALGNRLVADRGGQFSGTATLRARVTGSIENPQFSGTVSTGGAGYIDPTLNLRFVDIGGSATLSGERAVIDSLTARLSTGGAVSVSGSVGLAGRNDVNLVLRLDAARYADGNLLVATLGGDLRVTGELAGQSLVSGNVLIERADITIPESFGSTAALVVPEHRNILPAAAATLARARVDEREGRAGGGVAPSVGLDLTVSAPNQIFVRGRGLDAEVGGSVRLTGTVDAVQPVGAFRLNRGRLSILGQRITFEEGSVTLVGDLDPYLDFRARTEGQGATVFVDVTGRVSEPEIAFSSNPPLPEDEVLSRLLFGRSMGELTPLQVGRLAGAAAELAGGSNTSLVDSLRARTGLDDLDIVAGEDGNLAVQAGTYIQDNVYLGVQAGADGQSRATINLDLTDDIKARAATGSDGETSIGVFFESDY